MGLKLVFGVLFLIIVVTLMSVYYFMPFSELEFTSNPRNYNFSVDGSTDNMQFYPNMRFRSKDISYKIINCSLQKQGDALKALDILSNSTILRFYPVVSEEEIKITCDEKTKFEGNMFIAGEGGPTKIISSDQYKIIFEGMILLLRDSSCPRPNIAIHELLHALGFIHSNNKNNIMYNFTNCNQVIGDEIPTIINDLYSIPSLPNLIVEDASASLSGRYLNLNFSIRNNGFEDAQPSLLQIKMEDKIIKEIAIKDLEIGTGQIISLGNIFISKITINKIELIIEYKYPELYKEDNTLFLELKK